MSTVLNFFREHSSPFDEFHKLLSKVPDLQASLIPVRQAMLATCGAQMNPKTGTVELMVVDLPRWNKLSEEQAVITDKLQAVDRMVEELDSIFAEIEAAGLNVSDKTPHGIWAAAPHTDPPYQDGEYINAFGKRVNRYGLPIKSVIDPRFEAWGQRAEAAMANVKL